MAHKIISLIRSEPVMVKELIVALISLAVAFGLKLTAEQSASIITVATISLGLVARQHVSPVKSEDP